MLKMLLILSLLLLFGSIVLLVDVITSNKANKKRLGELMYRNDFTILRFDNEINKFKHKNKIK